MERTLANFIRALRMAEVRISTSETLDAFRTTELVGWRDRETLKYALATVLPKTREETEAFDACFDRFFRFDQFDSRGEPDGEDAESADNDSDAFDDEDENQEQQAGDGQGGGGGERDESAPGGGGGQGEAGDEDEELEDIVQPGEMSEARSELGQLLMNGDRAQLSMEISQAAKDANIEEIRVFTQKGLYTRRIMEGMGLSELQTEMGELGRSDELPDRRLGNELRKRRDGLREQIRDYVERQFLLHADADGKQLREELLKRVKLNNVEQRNFHHLRRLVQKMAKKLVAAHSRKRRVTKRGALNVPRMIRKNLRYDGNMIELAWKSTKIDKPKVFVICDVSGSVAAYARFMLMFLYSLEEVLPNVRAFAFSSDLGEVTDLFKRNDLEDAIAKTLRDYSGGSTDYGQAFEDFARLALDQVDQRSTVIILGDARNNDGNPRTDLLRALYDRSRRVIWLNPEAELSWGSGDSEMPRYRAHCHQVNVCNSLQHLERVVSDVLRAVT
ncbi:MAG TPA: VWA domain-containing protein [Pseudomonadales bacterium]|nr:VWA domain-containing protein [Pseudomonadales bacterium]